MSLQPYWITEIITHEDINNKQPTGCGSQLPSGRTVPWKRPGANVQGIFQVWFVWRTVLRMSEVTVQGKCTEDLFIWDLRNHSTVWHAWFSALYKYSYLLTYLLTCPGRNVQIAMQDYCSLQSDSKSSPLNLFAIFPLVVNLCNWKLPWSLLTTAQTSIHLQVHQFFNELCHFY